MYLNPLIIAVDNAAVVHHDRTGVTARTSGTAGGVSGSSCYSLGFMCFCIAAVAAFTAIIFHLNPLSLAGTSSDGDDAAVGHRDQTGVTTVITVTAGGGSGMC